MTVKWINNNNNELEYIYICIYLYNFLVRRILEREKSILGKLNFLVTDLTKFINFLSHMIFNIYMLQCTEIVIEIWNKKANLIQHSV